MEPVYILGAGRTDFKRNLKKEGKTILNLIAESGRKAIADAKIDPKEIEAAAVGNFNAGQFQEFTTNGAIGSHLENLQRKGGFKGFNQHAVSIIIAETDPRKQQAH